ncbi:MAG: DUF454 domain-containing protein [Tissierella sp.]|nr:DUF454 domain-containing protein [Tissierella sp.]
MNYIFSFGYKYIIVHSFSPKHYSSRGVEKQLMKRIFFIILGCVGLIMSVVGAIVPLLPAFPFVVLTAFSFSKSSDKLHNWFLGTKLYKNNFESFVKGKGMRFPTKIKIIISITITMSIGFYMMDRMPIGRAILSVIWIGHIIYFIFFVKTIKKEELDLTYRY